MSRVIERLLRGAIEDKVAVTEAICDESVQDFSAYKYLVGRRVELSRMINSLEESLKQLDEEE